mmetsp:Transcript_10115/g.13256  ORF Transcript_10115/g.13256 Transcript_10115/m.13256 type:complete len:558 (-) Transcript_10115:327-2000(-)
MRHVNHFFVWLKGRLADLKSEIPFDQFHNGDPDIIQDDLQKDETSIVEEGIFTELVDRAWRLCEDDSSLHQLVHDVFPFYVGTDTRSSDLLAGLCDMLYRYVIKKKEHLGVKELTHDTVEGEMITIKTRSLGLAVPVVLLPLSTAIKCMEPPRYGTIPIADGYQLRRDDVLVFVSHQWGKQFQPDEGSDWKSGIVSYLSEFVYSTARVINNMIDSGCQLNELNECFLNSDSNLEYASTGATLAVRADKVKGQMHPYLSWKIMTLTLQHYSASRKVDQVVKLTLERILLWYDWCCLPQKIAIGDQREGEEKQFFDNSLNVLDEIQRKMCTLCVNTNQQYHERAWCFAEAMNARLEASLSCEEQVHGESVSEIFKLRFDTGLVFLRLVNCKIKSPATVLQSLDKRFTQEDHIDNAKIVVWLLWKAVLPYVDITFAFGLLSATDTITSKVSRSYVIGHGSPRNLSKWLLLIRDAMSGDFSNLDPDAWNCVRRSCWVESQDADIVLKRIIVETDGSLLGSDGDKEKFLLLLDRAIQELTNMSADLVKLEFFLQVVAEKAPT